MVTVRVATNLPLEQTAIRFRLSPHTPCQAAVASCPYRRGYLQQCDTRASGSESAEPDTCIYQAKTAHSTTPITYILILYSLCGERHPEYNVYVNEERPQPFDGALVRGEGSCGVFFWALAPQTRVSYAGRKKRNRFSPETRLCSWHNGFMPTRVRSADTERSAWVVFPGGSAPPDPPIWACWGRPRGGYHPWGYCWFLLIDFLNF